MPVSAEYKELYSDHVNQIDSIIIETECRISERFKFLQDFP